MNLEVTDFLFKDGENEMKYEGKRLRDSQSGSQITCLLKNVLSNLLSSLGPLSAYKFKYESISGK